MKPWHGYRPEVLAAMRLLGDDAEREYRRAQGLQPPHGTVGVGGADFDHRLRYVVLSAYLRALRVGSPPAQALAEAVEDGRFCVEQWNKAGCLARAVFGGHFALQRDIGAGDAIADAAHRRFAGFPDPDKNEEAVT